MHGEKTDTSQRQLHDSVQDSQNRTATTGQAETGREQDGYYMTARTGGRKNGSKNRSAITGHPRKDCHIR